MSFSSQTSSVDVQTILEEHMEKKKKNLLTGQGQKTACVFIDDVNMPDTDDCGTQMPIELL